MFEKIPRYRGHSVVSSTDWVDFYEGVLDTSLQRAGEGGPARVPVVGARLIPTSLFQAPREQGPATARETPDK